MMTIIRLTYLEMIKKKILLFTCVMTFVFFALYGLALYFIYREMGQTEQLMKLMISGQILSLGIYASGFIIAFLAIFISAGSVSTMVDQGIYDVILAAPIKRTHVILGRYLGLQFVLIVYSTMLYLGVVALNTVIGHGHFVHLSSVAIIKSLLVIYLMPVAISTVGFFLSTSISTIGSGIVITILYFCGMVGGFLEQIGYMLQTDASPILVRMGIITSLIIPTDVTYRKSFSYLFTTSSGIDLSAAGMMGKVGKPSDFMMVYIVIYILVFLGMTIRTFNRKDI